MMNYYAQGGETLGIKSLAQQLPSYGRYNDDMVAHISSDEARLLKAMGGAGTINPVTGLPEFGFFKSVFKPVGKVLSGFDDVVLQPITGGIQDLVQGVAKATGPVGQIAATYFGGPIGAGIYAGLSGKDGFNFKRALLAGAMAYGAQNLAEGLTEAGGGSSVSGGAPSISVDDAGVALLPADAAATASAGQTAVPSIVYDDAGVALLPADQAAMQSGIASLGDQVGNFASTAGQNIAEGVTKFGTQTGDVLRGGYKLASGDPQALAAFKASGATMTNTALPMFVGYTGMAGMDEAEKMKDEADLANAKSQEEYDSIMARIEKSRLRGVDAVKANPYMFAMGGSVDDEAGIDSLNFQRGNMDKGMFGGQLPSYAKGGEPRFLSGGGDGMSDDIKATINGTQPARLADGEFVIPADVVSHLGNGSSKAGAKQLYSMMDKVRSARTGNKKQGKQINPAKFMPA